MSTLSQSPLGTSTVKRAVRHFLDHDTLTYAAPLAYQVLFALFPFIIFLVTLLGFLHLEAFFTWLRQQAAIVLPGQALDAVNRVLDEIQQRHGGLLSVSVLLALVSASGGVR